MSCLSTKAIGYIFDHDSRSKLSLCFPYLLFRFFFSCFYTLFSFYLKINAFFLSFFQLYILETTTVLVFKSKVCKHFFEKMRSVREGVNIFANFQGLVVTLCLKLFGKTEYFRYLIETKSLIFSHACNHV